MDDGTSIPISALQHYLFCPRQCALIHVERLWAENVQTAEGRILHERSDARASERRRGVRTLTALPLASERLGIAGIADVVELHDDQDGTAQPFPVEYKRGRPKAHRADEVQLCAQALCLEEMFGRTVPAGALFYGRTRRRREVAFDGALRALTDSVIAETRQMMDAGHTPAATYEAKRCDNCSLLELCRPHLSSRGADVDEWLRRQLED